MFGFVQQARPLTWHSRYSFFEQACKPYFGRNDFSRVDQNILEKNLDEWSNDALLTK